MKRPALITFLSLFAIISAAFISPALRLHLKHAAAESMNRLSRKSFAANITDSAWSGWITGYYAGLRFFKDADLALPAYAHGRVIFFGDSITEFWATRYRAEFFPGKPYIGRGVGGQTTGNMIWRFHQDVIQLHPDTVVILAGTNDILRHRSLNVQTEKDFQTMVQMAQHHGIRVILCSIPPIKRSNPVEQSFMDQQVPILNAWLRQYAAQQHLAFVDYYSALVGNSGQMSSTVSTDGIHPNLAGYALMRPLAQQALDALPPNPTR